MNHWATAFIGLPHVRGATGPDAYDCWGFVRHIQLQQYGRNLPDVSHLGPDTKSAAATISNHDERDNWVEVDQPEDGDLVLMARNQIPVHIGIWIHANGTGGVLHSLERVGVTFSNGSNLKNQGWGKVRYFRSKVKNA